MVELCYINEYGREKFETLLDLIIEIKENPVINVTKNILEDEQCSQIFIPTIEVKEDPYFKTRYEIGKYLDNIFNGIDKILIRNNFGIWDWLTLLWFDNICPIKKGERKVLVDRSKYIVSKDYNKYYRHLILSAWETYSIHGKFSRLFLDTEPQIFSDLAEQLTSSQDIITNNGLIEAAYILYWDESKEEPKVNASTEGYPGNARRFVNINKQLSLTYDTHLMTADKILKLLPKEYDEWKSP